MDASGCDVGGDQCRYLALLKIGQCTLALALALVTVHRCGLNVLTRESLYEPVGAALGADENKV